MSEKYNHGKHHVVIDISTVDYSALTDGLGRPIPFQINAAAEVTLSVKLEDSTAFANLFFTAGDNPDLVIAIEDDATVSDVITALYPFKPATTTINTTY